MKAMQWQEYHKQTQKLMKLQESIWKFTQVQI